MTPDEVIGFVRRDRQTEDQDELDRQRNQQRRSHKTPRMITHLRGAPASRRRARGRDRRDLPILQDAPQSTLAAQHISLFAQRVLARNRRSRADNAASRVYAAAAAPRLSVRARRCAAHRSRARRARPLLHERRFESSFRTAQPRFFFPTRAASSCARCAPPLKIGSAMLGLKAHANAPALNSPESASLAIPYWPVKEMLGKNAARAAPICALAARSISSAAMMSGRRVSKSEGTPAGKSANIPCGSNAAAGGKLSGRGCPSSRTSAFSAWARARNWFCSFVRARAAALSASVRSSALATPASTRSLTKRSDSSAAASASCVTFNCSSNARSVRYCLASCATSAISAARQACAVDR